MVGLLVTNEGFPVGYEVFEGNTFEGHTMLPVLKDFAKKYSVVVPTVVADAAMISVDNVTALNLEGFSFIVGARLANNSKKILSAIKAAPAVDGSLIRLSTDRGDLICAFSSVRYRKDKHEMDKQWKKAEELVGGASMLKRTKFVQRIGDEQLALNETLKAKAETLLG